MAVAEVFGKCEGYNVIFRKNLENGHWETSVPFERDGEYVIELYAVDEAGNEAYCATILCIVNVRELSIKVRILEIAKEFADFKYSGTARMKEYLAEITSLPAVYQTEARTKQYSVVITSSECDGNHDNNKR